MRTWHSTPPHKLFRPDPISMKFNVNAWISPVPLAQLVSRTDICICDTEVSVYLFREALSSSKLGKDEWRGNLGAAAVWIYVPHVRHKAGTMHAPLSSYNAKSVSMCALQVAISLVIFIAYGGMRRAPDASQSRFVIKTQQVLRKKKLDRKSYTRTVCHTRISLSHVNISCQYAKIFPTKNKL